ncbi:hypothetical protein [Flavobacterium lacus]|uniref:AhpC/TSA family protein n=1 Tax=Flavobacterium lacus TaxID=1353778 RepID=A0A328WZ80_9FLAO|nr:hypothetical protein [Flavobacterium lacus]RAR48169.1 hypothetical protein B0I10_106172 [Flavobacterium lacus]
MKKNIVLFSLFILPIVAYLFFASGVHNFTHLPTVTESIPEVNNWKNEKGEYFSLEDKITVLVFPGTQILYNKGDAFNLNQKIYEKVMGFKDFQLICIAPFGTEEQTVDLKEELGRISDMSKWNYVFSSPEEIKNYYNELNLIGQLDENLRTPNVFIIDKERNLRGRKGKNKKGEPEYKEGYNSISAADLHNEMGDDIKIILAEYRLALKKNSADRKK